MKRFSFHLILTTIFIGLLIIACESDDSAPGDGTGTIYVAISGLPVDNDADVQVTGPAGYNRTLNSSDSLKDLTNGTYTIRTKIKVYRTNPISIAYRTEDLVQTINVAGNIQTANVQFFLMPGSGRIWFGNQTSDPGERIISYRYEKLGASGDQAASNTLTGNHASPRGMAYDDFGNLWTVDGAGQIHMFSWERLAATDIDPDQSISVGNPWSITFDADSNLWCTTSSSVLRFSREDIYSGSPAPDVTLTSSSFDGLKGLAFDNSGNLWLANENDDNLLMIRESDLSGSGEITPEILLTCQSLPPVVTTLSAPYSLAFDRNNNLFVGYFGPNVIVRLDPSERKETATITPPVQIKLSTSVLIDHMAFDEQMHLWLPLGEGAFGRVNNSNLSSAGLKVPDIFITSNDLKYGSGMAIYVAPEGVPLN